jgi:flagellar hook assembly protein FlgD
VGLSQATPNPFTGTTTIALSLPEAGQLELEVFDVQGARVRTLARGHHAAGAHRFEWDGRDDAGERAASGIYFYRVQAAGVTETKKIVMAR